MTPIEQDTIVGALPVELRRTIIFDNGKEFAEHDRLKRRTGIRSFFAEPYKSWQRVELSHVNQFEAEHAPAQAASNPPLAGIRKSWAIADRRLAGAWRH